MGYDIILFDADGTLIDFNKSERVSFEKTMNAFNLPFSETQYTDYHAINDGLWKDFERGQITKPALLVERYRRLAEKYNFDTDPAGLNLFYMRALGGCSYLLDGAAGVCRCLAQTKKRLYLVTNGETTVQQNRYTASEIKQYFNNVFVSETVGYPKPCIEYFDYVFARIENFERNRTIIGDSLTGDIRGGNNAKITTCWYNPDRLINDRGVTCDFTIASLTELYDILL